MPWNESTRMDERRRFVEAYLSGRFSLSELCRAAGVPFETEVVSGDAVRALSDLAVERNCAHIVIGAHGPYRVHVIIVE